MARSSFVAGAGVVIGLLTAAPAVAATFTVNSTPDAVDASPGNGVCATAAGACTLRAAIQEANALSGSDTITLPSGTYTFTLAGTEEDASTTGDLDVSSVIVVNGADASTTIINANGNGRGFEVHAGGNLTLNDVTVQNGFAELQLFSQIGGGILAHPGLWTLGVVQQQWVVPASSAESEPPDHRRSRRQRQGRSDHRFYGLRRLGVGEQHVMEPTAHRERGRLRARERTTLAHCQRCSFAGP